MRRTHGPLPGRFLLRIFRLAGVCCLHEAARLARHAPVAEANHHAVIFVLAEDAVGFWGGHKGMRLAATAIFAHLGIEYQVSGMPRQPGKKNMALWLDLSQYTQF